MPATSEERVRLLRDYTRHHSAAVAGAQGWSIRCDNGGLAASPDWWAIRLDAGPRVEVRRGDLELLPWPALGWPLPA